MHLILESILTALRVTFLESPGSQIQTQNPALLGPMYGVHGITKTLWESTDLTSAWTELM